MNPRSHLTLLALLTLAGGVQAQQPSNAPIQVHVGAKVDLGKKDYLKGWYLFWPDYALMQPRLPMPYPWWPQQAAPAVPALPPAATPPAPEPVAPPAPLQLPGTNSGPGSTSWGPGYAPNPLQPVSYPVYVPAYWWQP